ncbi:MAG: Thiol:disulfide interchange protein DsbC [Pseudidiomarina mangrovi]|nr:MAG: Thiol:disulfide interchange protein DsbC [Pseudidiomarina mangrovi]
MTIKVVSSWLALSAAMAVSLSACSEASPRMATTTPETSTADAATIDTSRLTAVGFKVESVQPSPIAGVYEVITDQGLFYVANDGALLISGRMYDITGPEPVNISDLSLNSMRQQQLQQYTDTMLVYAAPQEKHVITVFTDPTCGYCKQLHQNMAQYHDAGVTVRYLAYPRSGVSGSAGKTLQNVWCSSDPLNALSVAKNGGIVPAARCDNPVAEHYALGQKFGVTGTPAIILPNGELIPGLLPLPMLLERLADL